MSHQIRLNTIPQWRWKRWDFALTSTFLWSIVQGESATELTVTWTIRMYYLCVAFVVVGRVYFTARSSEEKKPASQWWCQQNVYNHLSLRSAPKMGLQVAFYMLLMEIYMQIVNLYLQLLTKWFLHFWLDTTRREREREKSCLCAICIT